MKKFIKRGAIGLVIIMFTGGSIFLLSKFITYKIETKVPDGNESVEQIVEKNKDDLDNTKIDKSKISNSEDIYAMVHQMANTLIVAEDGLIIGEKPINEESINEAMVIVKDTDLIYNEETEVFLNILQEWKDNDYSQGVQAHNYAWKLLHGNMGRAKELRSEYLK
ncbi:DUF6241 domain-containing protein [Clostridium sp.]|uniref:DUF6241 domain-containing protein n=1 Tax=Clostridium sp. TaxID=1506 RepID=UPI001A5227BD|nr:DUF6241 domain-containing protein [Clostridium sp.]MBK5240655.1 hypothetical protein [Clostridium sp.]